MHPALVARRRRISALRQRIVAATLATFVLSWGVVAWNGSMGETTDHGAGHHDDHDRAVDGDRGGHADGHRGGDDHRRRLLDAVDGAVVMGEHFFWITSRAAGIVALLASSAAVSLGLMMSMRLRKGQDLRVMHEALSLATMVALAVHALALLGDGYLKPSLADVTIPFVSDYARWWMSLGIVGGWTVRDPRPVVLLARPDRPAALAHAAPLHGAGLAARRRPLARDGHGRRRAVVPLAAARSSCPRARCSCARRRPRRWR